MGENYWYRLSLGDREEKTKYYKDDKAWEEAEKILRKVLKSRKCDFVEAKNEAAFYGPKIDVQMKNVRGKEDTAFTVQYDFVMPKRFNLTYIDEKGKEREAVVVHRSSIGAIERTIAFLLEYTAGKLPLWLSPIQAVVLNVGENHLAYAKKIEEELKINGIRAEIREMDSLGKRIREAELQKIPYILVVGDKEAQNKTINVRHYKKGQEGEIEISKLINRIKKEIENKN
jgi:threonyl-tRNA synthetase